jgi:hypothetical protein
MSIRIGATWLLLLLALGLSGCKRDLGPVGVVEDPTTHLPEPTGPAVADWLNLSRPELDQKFDDWKSDATKLLDIARGDRNTVALLPKLRPVLTLPVFQEARFSARSGLTLPPYAEDGHKDAALALHLARFGDADGALLVSDPADASLRKEIDALRGNRNYPVEWTRLITLAQFVAELRLARNEPEAAANLISLHQQLRIVLDPKASAGPLGSVLLSGGRRALQAAAVAWDDNRKIGLVSDVQAALAAWGEVPVPTPALVPGSSREAVEGIFPPIGKAHSVSALAAKAGRVFDLLAAPLPGDDLEGIVAFLDSQDKLAQITVLYRPRAGQTYPDPTYVAQRLVAFGATGQEATAARGSSRQTFASGNLNYEITLVPRGSTIGALVRVGNGTPAPAFMPPDPRDFGAIHFDRTFDQNRLAVAPEQRSAEVVTVSKPAEVRRVAPPAPEQGRVLALPGAATLQLRRLQTFDLLASLSLNWDRGHNLTALARLAVPLWTAYGSPQIEPGYDQSGGHLAVVWESETMRFSLRLPHDDDQPPTFTAEDKRGTSGAGEREKLARTFDRDQRAARLAAGKPLQRLPREFEEASAVKLGMPRSEVEAALPASQGLRKIEINGGWSVFFLKPPAGESAATPEQLLVRVGPGDKVAELRLRYLERFVPKGDRTPTLLAHLSTSAGAPETLASPWAALWSDLPPLKPAPVLYRWKDDTTSMTLQRDSGGAEVALRDCPADQPAGVSLAPLQFLSRGVEGCVLGDAQSAVLQRWKITEPSKTADGGIVLPMTASSPYGNVVVYFANGRAVRILAYHKIKDNFQPGEVPAALQESWGRDLDHLGCVRRQDAPAGKLLGGFGWNDDVTRVRTFSLDSDQGPQLYTEWREWAPAPPEKGVAVAR